MWMGRQMSMPVDDRLGSGCFASLPLRHISYAVKAYSVSHVEDVLS